MAYNKEKIYNQAIEAITKNNLFFIEDIVAWLPISKATFTPSIFVNPKKTRIHELN